MLFIHCPSRFFVSVVGVKLTSGFCVVSMFVGLDLTQTCHWNVINIRERQNMANQSAIHGFLHDETRSFAA